MRLGNQIVDAINGKLTISEIDYLRMKMDEIEDAAAFANSIATPGKATEISHATFVGGSGNIIIDESGVSSYNEGSPTGRWETDGDFFLGSNILAPATTSFCFFSNDQTYNGEVLGAGDALFGDNSVNKASMLWDYSDGQLKFRGGPVQGTVQAYVGTDGKIYFGGGNGWLSSDGIRLIQGTDSANKILWLNSSVERASVYSYQSALQSYVFLSSYIPNTISNAYAHASLTSYMSGVLGSEVQIQCTSTNDAASENSVDLYINGTGSGSHWYVNREQFDYDFYVGTALVSADVRVSGGVYIGATNVDPAAGSLNITGNFGFGVVASATIRGIISGASSDLSTVKVIRTDATSATGGPNLLVGVNDGAQTDSGHRLGLIGFQSTYDGTDANLGTVANWTATTLEAPTSTSKGTRTEIRRNPVGIAGNVVQDGWTEVVLEDNVTKNLFEVALPTLTHTGEVIKYMVSLSDGTDVQSETGIVFADAQNKAGAYTGNTTVPTAASNTMVQGLSAGTLAGNFGWATGSNKVTMTVIFNTSLTPTSMRLYYKVTHLGKQVLTFL